MTERLGFPSKKGVAGIMLAGTPGSGIPATFAFSFSGTSSVALAKEDLSTLRPSVVNLFRSRSKGCE